MPIVQPPLTTPKKEDMELEEIVQEMRDLQIKLARLEEKTSTINLKAIFKQGKFDEMVQQGIVYWKDGKIVLKDSGHLLQTNFNKEGMKALVKDYLAIHGISTMEAASYRTRIDNDGRQNFIGNVQLSGLWCCAISTMLKEKISREALLRAAAIICGATD
uniref:Predicted protein n=1 Tax=Physcomitrium patens TaxID=3218 RepID=A9U4G5_PHYPA